MVVEANLRVRRAVVACASVTTMSRKTLVAVAVYVAAACLFTWPLALHLRTLLGAMDVNGDASLNLWALGWDLRVISEHPSWLLTGRVFDANIFFPAPRTLAYSDNLLPQALALWPVYALTGDLVLCYNLLFAGSLVATALATHVLARVLTGSERAAYIGGLVFGFAPYHFAHLGHLQLQALYFMPLSFLCLHRIFERGRRIDSVMLGVVLAVQAVSSIYYGIIGGIGVAAATVSLALLTRRVFDWRLLRQMGLALLVAMLVSIPWAIPYLLVHSETGAGRSLGDAGRGGTVLANYLQAPATNLLYGRTGLLRPGPDAWLPYMEGVEQELFPGFAALLLALLGCVYASKDTRRMSIVFTAVAAVGVLLSMGPASPIPLYALLYRGLFGMAAIRAVPRFSVLVLLGIAMLAAFAVRALELRRPHLSAGIFAVALLAIGVEYSNGAIAYPAPPPLSTGAGAWLRGQPGSAPVVCVPMRVWLANTPCMLQSLEHHRPIVNGYSGVMPPFFEAMVETANRLPAADALLAMHSVGVEYVVSDMALTAEPAFGDVLVERALFGDQHVYQLQWSPEIEAKVRGEMDTPPPDPGPIPFAAGEASTYRVRWTSGPLELSAGEATISVLPPQPDAAYTFRVDAQTAPWMSRFYEAIVRLESTTSAALVPLTYSEVIDEGTKRIERQLTFDPEGRQVRIVSGGTTIVLPVGLGARDAISAFFYLRTLPLSTGARYAIPISDNGRPLRLDVRVETREPVTLDGRPVDAWKLELAASERIDRAPLRLTAWISADERRVPLVVDVSANFGTARVELTRYQRDATGGP